MGGLAVIIVFLLRLIASYGKFSRSTLVNNILNEHCILFDYVTYTKLYVGKLADYHYA